MEQMREARLSEAIALQIAELILSGEIKSETKLRQEELAEILQVSRIPVREALQLLETQGLVKRLATRHIVTANLEESHIREVYGLIAEIERQAVESILGTGKEAEANLVAEGGNLAVHTGIAEKIQNTYVQTLLTNAIRYYVSYAEKLPQKDGAVSLEEIFRKGAFQTQGSPLLIQHFQDLADAVVAERRKQNDRT